MIALSRIRHSVSTTRRPEVGQGASRLKAQIVNYADDFVICCRGMAEEAIPVMRTMMER
jgi:hypothetical protein